jgi:hypothetical protein
MMRSIPFLFIILFTLSACSSNREISQAFHKYGHQEGVVKVNVPGWVIHLASRIADLETEERALLRQIDKVKVLTVEDQSINQQVNFYDEYYHKLKAKKGYEDLVMVRESEEQVGILGKFEGNTARELIILVGGDENTIVYLKGKIDPDTLKKLVNQEDLQKSIDL